MNVKPAGEVKRRTFIGAAFASLGLTGLYAQPPKPKPGSVPMREFGKTGVKLTITAGPGGVKGPALEYWKRNSEDSG